MLPTMSVRPVRQTQIYSDRKFTRFPRHIQSVEETPHWLYPLLANRAFFIFLV